MTRHVPSRGRVDASLDPDEDLKGRGEDVPGIFIEIVEHEGPQLIPGVVNNRNWAWLTLEDAAALCEKIDKLIEEAATPAQIERIGE